MGMSASGIGSGLDINSIVTQLMKAENAPLDRLKQKESSYNTKLSAYGTFKSALSTFQTSLKGLSSSGLSALTATSSNTALLGVSAATNAKPGNYSVQVVSLAQEQKIAAKEGVDSPTKNLGRGTMSIQVGNKPIIKIIEGQDYTLNSLVDAINSANAGVTATIINDGSDMPYRLVISANDTWVKNPITISGSETDPTKNFAFSSENMEEVQEAKNANIKINNIDIIKPSNNITDAIAGVSLQLTKADIATTVNVTVAQDKGSVKSAITNFVSAYNTLYSDMQKLTSYDTTTKIGGSLNGDQGARSVLNALKLELSKAVAGNGLESLSNIGVSFQRDGKLAVDDSKLQKAVDTKFDDIAKLFSSENGYATRLTKLTEDALGSQGVVATHIASLENSKKGIVASQDSLQVRLDATEKRIRAQFVALDAVMSRMQSTSSYLSQQLAALAKNN